MALQELEELKEIVSKVEKNNMYNTICKNIKKFRLEKYNEFKKQNGNQTINPFSSENFANLLDYNHYKRFESESDSTKQIPLDKLVKISLILEKKLDDFLK